MPDIEGSRVNPVLRKKSQSGSHENHNRESPPEQQADEAGGENQHTWTTSHASRAMIGAILLAGGTVLLIPLSTSALGVPSPVGSVASVMLALGTLLLGTATRGRAV